MGPMARIEFADDRIGLKAFVVVDRLGSGLCAGGLRFTSEVSTGQLEPLASLMTLKFGIAGVRVGGAKAGIAAARKFEESEKVLLRRTGELLEPFLRSYYLLGEDLGTTTADIRLIYEHVGLNPVELVRAKIDAAGAPLAVPGELQLVDLLTDEFSGIAAGYGVAEAVMAAAELQNLRVERLRAAVQGFGTVGRSAAQRLAENGVVVVAVADIGGTLFSPLGLDLAELDRARGPSGIIDRRQLHGRVSLLPRSDWYKVPADVLIPAAAENALSLEDIGGVSRDVRLIVEGANAPIRQDAEAVLERAGIAVIPDFIAGAGSAAAFGLLITGQVRSLDHALAESWRRIVLATREALGPGPPREGARQRALAIALRTFEAP
jgi:glutamate dehydrogenase (NAD(P)+)